MTHNTYIMLSVPDDALSTLSVEFQQNAPPETTFQMQGTYHVTLCACSASKADLDEVIQGLVMSDVTVRAKGMVQFSTKNRGTAVAVSLERTSSLVNLQRCLYNRLKARGIAVSKTSDPQDYHPHITLGFIPDDSTAPPLTPELDMKVRSINVTGQEYTSMATYETKATAAVTAEARGLETKVVQINVDDVDMAEGIVEGFASMFGNIDQGDDVMHYGAFTKTLQERGDRVKFLWAHDTTQVLGRILRLEQRADGLFFRAKISKTDIGRRVLQWLIDGAIEGVSIGFEIVKGGMETERDEKTGRVIRHIREVKLYEISLVTFPMNESAQVRAVKALMAPTKKGIEDAPGFGFTEGRACQGCVSYAPGTNTCTAFDFITSPQASCDAFSPVPPIAVDVAVLDDMTNALPPLDEVKAGRVISAANAERLRQARAAAGKLIDVIDALLSYVDNEEDEEENQSEPPKEKPPAEPPTKALTGGDDPALQEIENERLRQLEWAEVSILEA